MIGGLISTALSSGLENVFGNGLISSALCTRAKKDKPFEYEFTSNTTDVKYFISFSITNFYYPNYNYEENGHSIQQPYFDFKGDKNNMGGYFPVLYVHKVLDDGKEELINPNDIRYNNLFVEGVFGSVATKIPKGFYNIDYSKNAVIDWGDGENTIIENVNDISSSIVTLADGEQYKVTIFKNTNKGANHIYKKAGTYKIKVWYKFSEITLYPQNTNQIESYRIDSWGDIGLLAIDKVLFDYNYMAEHPTTKCIGLPPITESVVKNLVSMAGLGWLILHFLNGDFTFFTYNMPALSTIAYIFSSAFYDYDNIEIPDGSFMNAQGLIEISNFFYVNNLKSNVVKKIIIGNDFCRNCKRLYIASQVFYFSSNQNSKVYISIKDNFLRGCSRLVYADTLFSDTASLLIERIGENFMRECDWLTSFVFPNFRLPIEINKGIFKECPNIRSFGYNFYFSSSVILPEGLLSDIRTNTGRTKDIFYMPYFSAMYDSSMQPEELSKIAITFGKNMFSEDFLNNGRIICGSCFSGLISILYNDRLMFDYVYPFKGEAPPFWKHTNTCSINNGYYEDISNVKTIDDYMTLGANYSPSAIFGSQPAPQYIQQWDNIGEIPGNDKIYSNIDFVPNSFERYFLYENKFADYSSNFKDDNVEKSIRVYFSYYETHGVDNNGLTYYDRNRTTVDVKLLSKPIGKTIDGYYVFDSPFVSFEVVSSEIYWIITIKAGDIFTSTYNPMVGYYDPENRVTRYHKATNSKDIEIIKNYRYISQDFVIRIDE